MASNGAESEEEDYMSMNFDEPVETKAETSLQRRARLKREVGIAMTLMAKHPC